jgi:hypothetical protein
MNDMSAVIVPKSDQMNADDLIAGPRTIRVSSVEIRGGADQPVSIRYDGDGGKPYKPCKSMSRLLVFAWGADAKLYVGRSMTLYRDPTVKWGGMEVGGIRISHMTDIEKTFVLSLTATKGQRKPHTVRPLTAEQQAQQPAEQPQAPSVDQVQDLIDAARSAATNGTEAYQRYFGSITREERRLLDDRGEHAKNKDAAAIADRPADSDEGPRHD